MRIVRGRLGQLHVKPPLQLQSRDCFGTNALKAPDFNMRLKEEKEEIDFFRSVRLDRLLSG
jgi:hypothetical protein